MSRDRDGFSSFRISRAGRSAAFGVALPAAGQRSLDRCGGARARRRTPRSGRPAAPGAAPGRRPAAARPRRGSASVSLCGAARPGPGRHQPFQPGAFQRGGRLVVRRPGIPERRGGRGDRGAVRLDLPHHLVFDLHHVAGVEELAGQERRIASPARGAGSGSAPRPARPPWDPVCPLAWPCRLLITDDVRKILPDMDTGCTHLRPRVARFRRKSMDKHASGPPGQPAAGRASAA